jgi:hypothetical protein
MRYVGFNLDDEEIEKLKVITFVTKKNRTMLVKEGLALVFEKYSSSFEQFQEFVKNLEKKK